MNKLYKLSMAIMLIVTTIAQFEGKEPSLLLTIVILFGLFASASSIADKKEKKK